MGEKVYNKLVRDNIPAIIKANGVTPITKVLSDEDYRQELLKKLVEEATELRDSGGSLEERADVAEVLLVIDELFGYDLRSLEEARTKKAEQKGGFASRIFLEKTTETP